MTMATLSYAVILEPEAEGGFSVIVPALPEAHTQGETVEEALANAREVVELVLECRAEFGENIPPSDVDNIRVERVSVTTPAP
jgi:predicted RNase H-like HicB family nuclease